MMLSLALSISIFLQVKVSFFASVSQIYETLMTNINVFATKWLQFIGGTIDISMTSYQLETPDFKT